METADFRPLGLKNPGTDFDGKTVNKLDHCSVAKISYCVAIRGRTTAEFTVDFKTLSRAGCSGHGGGGSGGANLRTREDGILCKRDNDIARSSEAAKQY